MLEKLKALFASAPKTLPQATATLTEAQTALDSVSALFTAAGLNLEQMLAAGPESLKAHLESIDNTEELATALQEGERLDALLTTAEASLVTAQAAGEAYQSAFSAIGIPLAADVKPEAIKTAFDSHVSKATTLALAKTGHPPAHVPASAVLDDVTPVKTDTDKQALASLTEYESLITADNTAKTKESATAKSDYFAKNHAAIYRGMALRRRN